eukprot:5520849-Amphidinium_carterae.1
MGECPLAHHRRLSSMLMSRITFGAWRHGFQLRLWMMITVSQSPHDFFCFSGSDCWQKQRLPSPRPQAQCAVTLAAGAASLFLHSAWCAKLPFPVGKEKLANES